MNLTLPGKSLDAQFDSLWRRFERLSSTTDTLGSWTMRLRRWLLPVNVSFIVPIEDHHIADYLGRVQKLLRPNLFYAPQPTEMLHITLYQIGYLRSLPIRLFKGWSPGQLHQIADLAGQYLALLKPFEVQIGPINAFPNVAIAEVHDMGKLRLLYKIVAQSISPVLAPLPPYPLIPHITLGYFGTRPAAPIRNLIRPLRNWPALNYTVDHVKLTLYYRKPGHYVPSEALLHSVEEVIASMPIGAAP
jgi:2'-5' RNA ligase